MHTIDGVPRMFVADPYPQGLASRLAAQFPSVNVFNGGVPGYTSYHGIMLLRTRLRDLRPTLITVAYGWNDLMTSAARGPDAFKELDGWERTGEDVLLHTALYPFARRLRLTWKATSTAHAGPPMAPADAWTPNVPLDAFAHNLRRLVELCRARGAEVWLLTSPDAFLTNDFRGHEDAYDRTASAQLRMLRLGGIHSYRKLRMYHAHYNAAVRRVAAEANAPLVDVASAYAAHADEHLFTPTDAIHPLEAGQALTADTLATAIATRRP
jgi:lysophospholipase L1-like esterase